MNQIKVTLSLAGSNYVRFRSSYLDARNYKAFHEAIEGTRYVRDLQQRVATLDKVPGILKRLRDAASDGEPMFDACLEPEVIDALERKTAVEWVDWASTNDRIEKIAEEFKKRTGNQIYGFQRTGIQWLTIRRTALLADDMGTGKACSIHEPVLTPEGWRPIGTIGVGDSVIGSNGRPTRVTGIFPQGRKRQYKITLTDGAWCRATADHFWYVETPNTRKRKTGGRLHTTKELMRLGLHYEPSMGRLTGNAKWFIPVMRAVQWKEKKSLPIRPYYLGAMIANGCMVLGVLNHAGWPEQRAEIEKEWPENHKFKNVKNNKWSYWIIPVNGDLKKSTLEPFKKLGLICRAPEKFIPPEYLLGSIEQRLSLLQGLMDNDGTVADTRPVRLESGKPKKSRSCEVEYNTTSPQLADDVLHLIRSLGGVAWMSTRIPKYTYKGETLEGKRDHRIRMMLPDGMCPFRIPRKVARYEENTKYPATHAIESIVPDGVEESVCIRVAAKDSLYVTRDFILTHNTLQTIVALPAGAPTLVVCPSAVKGTWLGEVGKWRPQVTARILKGRDSFRWPASAEMLITNYDIMPDIHDRTGAYGRKCDGYLPPKPCKGCKEVEIRQLTNIVTIKEGHIRECTGFSEDRDVCPGCHPILDKALPGTVCVFDEAQLVKNRNAGRSQQCKAIAKASRKNDGRTWLLSGTPLENNPKELWNVLDVADLAQEAFDNYRNFLHIFKATSKGRFGGYNYGLPDEEDITERLRRVSLRRMKKDVLPDLPTKVWRDHIVDIDRATMRECANFVQKQGGIERIIALLQEDKFPFEMMSAIRAALATAKIPAMLEYVKYLEDEKEPVVVFSAHRAPIEALAKRRGWAVIMGDVDSAKRNKIVEDFQAGRLRGVGCTIRAGGTGLTLTRANQAVFVDRDWKSTANDQAEDRLVRIGQTRGVVITIIHANHPLDRRLTEVLEQKARLIRATIDASSVGENTPTDKELEEYLHRIQEEIKEGVKTERRMAVTDDEKRVLSDLHAFVFETKHDEKVALELAEEAVTIGLSETQWVLAAHVAKKGKPKAIPVVAPRKLGIEAKKSKTARPATRTGKKDLMGDDDKKTGGDKPVTEKEEKRERRKEVRRLRAGIKDMRDSLEDLEPEDRVYVFEELDEALEEFEERYCRGCGDEPHANAEDCPEYEEGDDEDEDEDEDEGEDSQG